MIGSAGNSTATRGSSNGTARRITEGTMLVPFFPFDPYKLKRSMRWVNRYYVEWEPLPGLDPDDSEDDEDEEEEEDDEDGEGNDKDQGEEDGDLTEVDETDGVEAGVGGGGDGDELVDQ